MYALRACWVTCVSEVSHWIVIRRMNSSYNIIEYILIELKLFELKYIVIIQRSSQKSLSS